ncbi:MAG: hypothetical protein ABW095_13255 [Candidatus Thiodiazotropha sp.]
MKRRILGLATILIMTLPLVACNKSEEGPAEKAGKKIDQSISETKQTLSESAEKVGEKIEEAGEAIQEKSK